MPRGCRRADDHAAHLGSSGDESPADLAELGGAERIRRHAVEGHRCRPAGIDGLTQADGAGAGHDVRQVVGVQGERTALLCQPERRLRGVCVPVADEVHLGAE